MSLLTDILRPRMEPAARARRAPTSPQRLARVAVVVALALLLALVESAALARRGPTARVDLGTPEAALVTSGFHAPEQDGARRFRWSAGQSEIRFLNAGVSATTLLGLRLGAGPAHLQAPDVMIALDGQPFHTLDVDDQPRRYLLLLPPGSLGDGQLAVGLTSATTMAPPDTRRIGLRVEEVSLDAPGGQYPLPAPGMALAFALLLGCVAVTLGRLRAPAALWYAGLAAAAAGMIAAQLLVSPPLLPIYAGRLAGAAAVLGALTLLLLPLIERHAARRGESAVARAIWGAALLACAVRLVGTLYPPFDAYDLALNLGRFVRTAGGDMVDTNRSFEFRSGVTVYPAGPYLALMPGVLLGLTPKLVVQGGIALLDGLGALATGALALGLGAGRRAGLFAALLYAGLPVMLTSLWFGHTAQVFGQGLMAPLALALLAAMAGGARRAWPAAGALLTMALLSHIGVTILAAAWLALAWPILGRTASRRDRLSFLVVLAAAGLAGLALVYGPELGLKLAELRKVSERVDAGGAPAYNLIWRAIQISFYELGWMLALPGLLLLPWRGMPRPALALLAAWLGAAVLFWAVEMGTALQVRYLVFLAPVACVTVGGVLGRLAVRERAGSAVAWVTTALLVTTGAATWFAGVFENVQMSMIPLLR